jgi:HSP20 family protein
MALPTRVQRFGDNHEFTQNEFDTLLGRLFGNREFDDVQAPYGVDVREDKDHLYVEAELPGFKKEEVDINLENQTLTISAEHRESNDPRNAEKTEKPEWLLRERRHTRFQRSFKLPSTVDSQSVQAKLNDGILTVTLNKREESKPRRITVA